VGLYLHSPISLHGVVNLPMRVLENRVLRKIFGPKREDVAEEYRRLHNEQLHKLYASPNIIRVIKSRSMRWARNLARMGEMRNTYKFFVGKPEAEDHSEGLGVGENRILD
jgi:hypothetical protein